VPDPVSWFLIERGWKVAGSDGSELGTVEEALGDENADIFDGLVLSPGLLSKDRYVPSERVTGIYEGRIEVDLDPGEVETLDEAAGAA
jgi:PRC-barrel domain protein